jgi:hypothetical protein
MPEVEVLSFSKALEFSTEIGCTRLLKDCPQLSMLPLKLHLSPPFSEESLDSSAPNILNLSKAILIQYNCPPPDTSKLGVSLAVEEVSTVTVGDPGDLHDKPQYSRKIERILL